MRWQGGESEEVRRSEKVKQIPTLQLGGRHAPAHSISVLLSDFVLLTTRFWFSSASSRKLSLTSFRLARSETIWGGRLEAVGIGVTRIFSLSACTAITSWSLWESSSHSFFISKPVARCPSESIDAARESSLTHSRLSRESLCRFEMSCILWRSLICALAWRTSMLCCHVIQLQPNNIMLPRCETTLEKLVSGRPSHSTSTV